MLQYKISLFTQLKRLVEEPRKSHFCEIEKTRFKVSKVFQRVTNAEDVRFLRKNHVSLINLATNGRTSAWLNTSDLNTDYGKTR